MAGRLLREEAEERSTYPVRVSFRDRNKQPVNPNVLTYTLYRSGKRVVNFREQVSITPSPSVLITLFGEDLALFPRSSPIRTLVVEGTYDSDNGINLPLRDSINFKIAEVEEPT